MSDQPEQYDNNQPTNEPTVEPVAPQPTPPSQPVAPQPYPQQGQFAPQPAAYGQPAPYAQPMENPGQTLGIIGLVLNFIGITIGGIILGIMSRSKSKAVNASTTLGTISMVWGIIGTVMGAIGIVLLIIISLAAASTGY